MPAIRVWFRLILVMAVAAAIPTLVLSTLAARGEVSRSRELYQASRAELLTTNQRLSAVESRLRQMTTSVAAVEWEARQQHRLVKPGEFLVLVEKQ